MAASTAAADTSVAGATPRSFRTEAEMDRQARDNLEAVLAAAEWKIKGQDGAAELLGVKPTTLLSRIKTLGLTRPPRRT